MSFGPCRFTREMIEAAHKAALDHAKAVAEQDAALKAAGLPRPHRSLIFPWWMNR